MTVPQDRRQKRSRDPLVALHYQLAQARQEASLDAIVVADDAGLVVAGAGAWAACEELAAYAPLLVQGLWNEPGLIEGSRIAELGAFGMQVDVQEVDVDGQTVLLCARRGGADGARAASAPRCAPGSGPLDGERGQGAGPGKPGKPRRTDTMHRTAQGVARILKAA